MKRAVVGTVILGMAPVAVAQTPPEKLVGAWSCSADFGYDVETWDVGYFDTGRMVHVQQDASLRVVQYDSDTPEAERPTSEDAKPVANETSTEGVWRIRKDGKLVEQLKRVIDTSIFVDGKKFSIGDPRELGSGETSSKEIVSSLSFRADGSFAATASDGIVTTCAPKKSP